MPETRSKNGETKDDIPERFRVGGDWTWQLQEEIS